MPRPRPDSSSSRRRAVLALLLFLPGAFLLAAVRPAEAIRIVARTRVLLEGGRYLPAEGLVLQETLWDCGPTALHNLLVVLRGSAPPPGELARISGTRPEGTSLAGLVGAARGLGVPLRVRRLPASAFASVRPPFLAWLAEGHFVTVLGLESATGILVHDPGSGAYRTSIRAFRRRYGGVVADLAPEVSAPSSVRTPPPGSGTRPPSHRR